MGRGRGRGKRTMKRDFKEKRDDTWVEKRQRTEDGGWKPAPDSSGKFEDYYQTQGICPPEEWDAFLATLRKPLPITFRINASGRFAADLRSQLETDFMAQFSEEPLVIEGEPVAPPRPLPWYPDRMAWHMDFSRAQLRKLPILGQLHEFMKRENEVGGITRQEAVSMVPPLFLGVQPHHRVLDMCAAPGSKTFQLLEMLHAGPGQPTGLVLANDADLQRCNLLTHQTKRINSPALVVTNHEAQHFPVLPNLDPADPERRILFDRILCDVPCSGDGTMRKAPDIWRRWNVGSGNGLHPLQLRITLRACELLRVGGRLVYSTCTFNPIEDEAVVAAVLRLTGGAFELLDVSDALPDLRRMPGLKRWRVMDKNGDWFDDWEAGQKGVKLDPTMFPDAASDALPLERCMRFLPHHQDTGGFFVAVLQKVAPLAHAPRVSLAHRTTKGKQLKQEAQARKKARRDEQEGQQQQQQPEEGQQEGDVQAAGAEAQAEPACEGAGPAAAAAAQAAAPKAGAEAEAATVEEAEATKEEERDEQEAEEAECLERQPLPKGLPAWSTWRHGVGKEEAAQQQGGGAEGQQQQQRQQKQKAFRWRGIDPILPFVDPREVQAVVDFYGLPADCPVPGALICRTQDQRPKRLHYLSPSVKALLLSDVKEQLKVTAAGVKVLERQESKDNLLACVYRLAQDGLPALLPFITRQRFCPTLEELLALLQDRFVALPQQAKVHITRGQQQQQQQDGAGADGADAAAAQEAGEGAEAAAAPEGEGEGEQKPRRVLRELSDPSTLEQLQALSYGCCVAVLRETDAAALGLTPHPAQQQQQNAADGAAPAAAGVDVGPLAVACWRGRGSLNVLVSKQEGAQIIERLLEAARHHGVQLPEAQAKAAAAAAASMNGRRAQQQQQEEKTEQQQEGGEAETQAEAQEPAAA